MPAFAPLLGEHPQCLLLGSMPSQISLKKGQYYANPQNCFWWLMTQIVGIEESADYKSNVAAVTGAGFAIWDVLEDCQRTGSLDSNILRSSEKCNDFQKFLLRHPSIKLIGFNGKAAEGIFMRHCGELVSANPQLKSVLLPSTSPAHARITKFEKFARWRDALPRHGVLIAPIQSNLEARQ